jgi:hypothetical protein
MHLRRFTFTGVLVTLIITVPMFGQLSSPQATGAAKAKTAVLSRTQDGQSDLQGAWSFANLTPLQRPPEFAGKATLTEQEAADWAKQVQERRNADRRDGGGNTDVSRAYNDSWYDYGKGASRQTSLIIDPPDGKLPPLTAEGQKRAQARATAATRPARGPEDRSLGERCILGFNAGPPMLPSAYNNNVQIFQTRDSVVLLNEMVHNFRIIPLDGRRHGTVRQWNGDSVGHWEGNTLVVDTINFSEKGTAFQIPTDENLHLIERFTRRDADTLIYEFTVEDPTVQTKAWTASVPMTWTDEPLFEYACHEGNYGMMGILQGARAEDKAAAEAARNERK